MILNVILILILIIQFVIINSDLNGSQNKYIFDSHESNIVKLTIKKTKFSNKTYYTIPISIGDKEKIEWGNSLQEFNLALDTVNIISWIPSINAKMNLTYLESNQRYNISKIPSGISLNISKVIYDSNGNLYGKLIIDYMNIGSSYILPNLIMLEILEYEKDFDDYIFGKIGLGNKYPQYKKYLNITSSLIDIFYQQKFINYKIFTLDKGNQLVVGGIPYKYVNDNYSTCKISFNNDLDDEHINGWICEISHFGIGDENQTFNSFYDISSSFNRIIFDSSYEYISFPLSYKELFKQKLIDKYSFSNCQNVIYNDITSYFICDYTNKTRPLNLTFIIDGFGYVIRLNDIIKKLDNNKIEILIRFTNSNSKIFIFGMTFFDKYTIVFNHENNTVGFYGNDIINYTLDWSKWKEKHNDYYKKGNITILFLDEIISIFFILVSSFGYIIWKLYFKKNYWDSNEHGPLIKNEQKN